MELQAFVLGCNPNLQLQLVKPQTKILSGESKISKNVNSNLKRLKESHKEKTVRNSKDL